jgi:hypothetical protein
LFKVQQQLDLETVLQQWIYPQRMQLYFDHQHQGLLTHPIKTPAAYDSDHWGVMTTMQLSQKEDKKYMNYKTSIPKYLLHNENIPADIIFQEINKAQDQHPR